MNVVKLEAEINEAPNALTRQNEELGRLTAEAVQSQYDAAATSISDLGAAVKDLLQKLESAMKECNEDMRIIQETVAEIKQNGQRAFAQIEHVNSISKEIRTACDMFRKKWN